MSHRLKYSKDYTIMKRLEINNGKEMSIAIRNEILHSEESRYDHRLHGLMLVSEGMSCYDAGIMFGEDPRTV